MSIISALRRLRQEDSQVNISLGYIAKSCVKKTGRVLVAHACNPSRIRRQRSGGFKASPGK
jgi:hypothetical protein